MKTNFTRHPNGKIPLSPLKALWHLRLLLIIAAAILLPKVVFGQCPVSAPSPLTQSWVDDFSTNYPTCTYFEGDLNISNLSDVTDLSGLAQLDSIGGDVTISGNMLTSLAGFEGIESIGGYLRIVQSALTSLSALSSLEKIGGRLNLNNNASLENLNGLQKLEEIGDNFTLYGNQMLTDISALSNITRIPGYIDIGTNNSLPNFHGLHNLEIIEGDASFSFNQENFEGLSGLKEIQGYVEVIECDNLINFEGLDQIEYISELDMYDNPSLESFAGLNSLERIVGLYAYQNPALMSLSGLEGIDPTYVGLEEISIFDNENLTECSVFCSWRETLSPDVLDVYDNSSEPCNDPEAAVCEVSCRDQVNILIGDNCQHDLSLQQVLNGAVNPSLRVIVNDENPGNGSIIDCAGLYTYGVFDANDELICWGEVLAEDKTAPIVEDHYEKPDDIECVYIDDLVNNENSIDPSEPLYIGHVDFADNCGDCGCAVDLKFFDRVEYLDCPESASFGQEYDYAILYRKWTATDCKGNSFDTTQTFTFFRPSLDDLVWPENEENQTCDIEGEDRDCPMPYWEGCFDSNDDSEYDRLYLDELDCNYSVTVSSTEFPICGGEGVKIECRYQVFDWCAEESQDLAEYLSEDNPIVKIGDFAPPSFTGNAGPLPLSFYEFQVIANVLNQYSNTDDDGIVFNVANTYIGIGGEFTGDVESFNLDVYDSFNPDEPLASTQAGAFVGVRIDNATFEGLLSIGVGTSNRETGSGTITASLGGITENLRAPEDRTSPVPASMYTTTLSTGPVDCTAAFSTDLEDLKSTFGFDIDDCDVADYSIEIWQYAPVIKYGIPTGDTLWRDTNFPMINGMATGIPVGRYALVIEAFDGCYNHATGATFFTVKDQIAPVMKCDDDLNVTLSTGGYAKVFAADIDEGSWDNCALDKLEVRRSVPESCIGSYFDEDDLSLEDGVYYTVWADHVEFFCCDLAADVLIELRGTDKAYDPVTGMAMPNTNICWMELTIEDKVEPICADLEDVTTFCYDPALEDLSTFGTPATPFSNCDNIEIVELDPVEDLDRCGFGTITRQYQAVKNLGTDNESRSAICEQLINVVANHDYWIKFPADQTADCGDEVDINGVEFAEEACDLIAVSSEDERFYATQDPDACYKIFRTYRVINWCEYDGEAQPTIVSRD